MSDQVLVTGGTGFVGGAMVRRLSAEGRPVRAAVRDVMHADFPDSVAVVEVAGLARDTNWSSALKGIGSVVHCAARAHVTRETTSNPMALYRRENVEGTLTLARQAVEAGVRRFLFVSSIGVNGGWTARGRPFRSLDNPSPVDPYAVSKWEAEQGLTALARETGLEVVIVRPPLVYGPACPGNFAIMLRWLASGIPLPLGAVKDNRRSLVGLDNLVDLMVTCLDHPAAANQVFLAGDGEDLSTAELLERIGSARGRPARLIPVPVWILQIGASCLGKKELARRLLGSLQVDISKARESLGWEPPLSVDEGLRRAVG